MEGLEQERRGVFGGIKPPFDLGGLILALIAILVFWAGVEIIEGMFDEPNILPRIFRKIDIPYIAVGNMVVSDAKYDQIKEDISRENVRRTEEDKGERQISVARFTIAMYVTLALWALIVWSVFAGAIGRVMAMKIARDEGMETMEALKFGFRKSVSNFMSIVTIGIAIFVLYFVCNSLLAGLVSNIPYVGEILLVPGYALIFFSCLIVLLLLVPLVFGNTLMSSAIATESSDSFDGLSRAFSYVYSRPWQVILFHALTFAYMAIFLFFGLQFVKISFGSLRTWGVGMEFDKARILQGFVDERNSWSAIHVTQGMIDRGKESGWSGYIFSDPALQEEFEKNSKKLEKERRERDAERLAAGEITLEDLAKGDGGPSPYVEVSGSHFPVTLRLAGVCIWFFRRVAILVILAYLVAYWFAANQAMYFILRRDVDGEDPSEIYIEEEEEEEPFEVTTPDLPAIPGAPPAAVTEEEVATDTAPPAAKPKKKSTRKPPAKKSSRRSTPSAKKKSTRQSGSKRSPASKKSTRGKKSERG